MIRFLIYCFKILIFTILGAIIIQTISDAGLKGIENSRFEEWDNILRGRINADLIILGSSRGSVNYNPKIIGQLTHLDSYNLSFDAASHNIQKAKYNIYLKNNLTPKVIIQNVDLAHFSSSLIIPNKNHFIPFSTSEEIYAEFRRIEPSFLKYNFIPLLNYNGNGRLLISGFTNLFNHRNMIFQHENGFVPVNRNFHKDVNNLERLKIMEANFNIDNWIENLKILEDQLESDRSIYYFFTWAPEYEERLIINQTSVSKIKMKIEEIIRDYPNAYFLDYSSHPLSKNANLFYDTFHLNAKGAKIFSKIIGEDINQILERNHAL